MVPYILTLGISCGLAVIVERFPDLFRKKNIIQRGKVILPFLPLVLLAALRKNIGVDVVNTYGWDYEQMLKGAKTSHSDIAFQTIMKIFVFFKADYQWFVAFTAILMVGLFAFSIILSKQNILFCLVLYFLTNHYIRSFCFVSQYIAVGLALLGYILIINNKKIESIICFIFAVLFHSTAFVFIVPVLIILLNKTKLLLIFSCALPLLTIVIRPFINEPLRWVISKTRFQYYIGSEFDFVDINRVFILINLAIWFWMFFLIKINKMKIQKTQIIYFFLQSISLCFCVMQGLVPLTYRIIWYFMSIQVISIPSFCELIDNIKIKKITILLIIMLELIWFVGWPVLSENLDGSLPYRSIFSE